MFPKLSINLPSDQKIISIFIYWNCMYIFESLAVKTFKKKKTFKFATFMALYSEG